MLTRQRCRGDAANSSTVHAIGLPDSLASETMRSGNTSSVAKTLAASALAQRGIAKQTGSATEDLAAKVLASPKYAEDTKVLAASVLSQSNKER